MEAVLRRAIVGCVIVDDRYGLKNVPSGRIEIVCGWN
jgi:hypothetical protein